MSSREKDPQFYYNVAELINGMNSYASSMSCMVYLKELDYGISNGGANDSAPLYNGKRVAFPDIVSYEDWLNILSGDYRNNIFFAKCLYYGNTRDCLIYADSINDFAQYEPFNLFVCLPISELEKLTRLLPDGSLFSIGIEAESILTLSNQGMEENPAEPECGWDGQRTDETDRYMEIHKVSGIKGVEYCLMIPKDEFWKELRQVRNVLGISVIVTLLAGALCVSAALHRNFEPVDRLVRKVSGGSKERSNEYKIIEDAYFRLLEEKNVMHRHIATQTEQMQSNYLLAMMKGRTIDIEKDLIQIGKGKGMVLAGFCVPLMDEEQILQDEVMLFAVDNILSELMAEFEFCRIEEGQLLFYLFMIDGEVQAFRESLYKSTQYLCDFMQQRGVSLCGVISKAVYETGKLRFAYQDVLEGLESVKMFRKCGIVDMEEWQVSGSKEIVRSVVQYVEQHFTESDLNINTIAEGIGRNPKYLSRVFKDETGEGILDYVNQKRIKKAQILMKSENMTLEQISEMVGYASVKTFRRAFQKETGMMPGSYLKDPHH